MPKRIEKYQLGKTLGRGTFSKVKYAIDTICNKPYAIKTIDRKMIKKENMEAQLKKEIAIMKILKHKNIVELKEVLQSNKHIYIVLELVTGGELFDRIVQAKRFSESTARRYFQQLISGVRYSHTQGIAHRDLKPENLLLDDNDNLKISDFGLSALSSSSDGSSKILKTTCGTPNYVAPEVLKEQGYSGFKADVWSCGVILYVMLAGYLPFEDETMSGLFNKIENGDYQFPSHFTLDVRKLISRMLTVNPKKRILLKDIIENRWFKVGYKKETMSKKLSVSKRDIDNSISRTQLKGDKGKGKEYKTKVEQISLNAFGLASEMLKGKMNPLVSPQHVKIRRETRFAVKGNQKESRASLIKLLEKFKANPSMKKDQSPGEIKCFVNYNKTLLTFSISISETKGGFSMVEVRRRKGDILQFNNVYRELLDELKKSGILVSHTKK